jgi:hypothetical protein
MSKRVFWVMIAAVLLIGMWLATMAMGIRILVSENLIKPGQTYIVEGYGDLGAGQSESLVCLYFTGRKIVTRVYHYAPNNMFGKDECPFLNQD